jgi:hypothetical protein
LVLSFCGTALVHLCEIYRRSQQRSSIIDRLYANKEPVGRARKGGGLRRTLSLRHADPNYISRADQERQVQEERRRRNPPGIRRNMTRAPAPTAKRTELTIFSVGGGAKATPAAAAVPQKTKAEEDEGGSDIDAEDEKEDEDEAAAPAPPAPDLTVPGADDMDGRFELRSTQQQSSLRERREDDIRRRIQAQKEADRRERDGQEQQAREARAAARRQEQEEDKEAGGGGDEDASDEVRSLYIINRFFLSLLFVITCLVRNNLFRVLPCHARFGVWSLSRALSLHFSGRV